MRSFAGRDILSLKDMERDEYFQIFAVADRLKPYRRRTAQQRPAEAQDAADRLLPAEHPHPPGDRGRHAPPRRPRARLLRRQDDPRRRLLPGDDQGHRPHARVLRRRHRDAPLPAGRARTRRPSGRRCRSSTAATAGASTRPRSSPTCTRSGRQKGTPRRPEGAVRRRHAHAHDALDPLRDARSSTCEAFVVWPAGDVAARRVQGRARRAQRAATSEVESVEKLHRRRRRHLHGAGRAGRLHQGPRDEADRRTRASRPPPTGSPGSCCGTKAKSDAIILHSLPRMDELPPDVDSTRHARYWVEAFNGVVMRMALLVARPRRGRVGGAMQTHLRGRDLITLQEWTKDELDTLLDVAFALKRDRALGQPHPYLRDKVLAMLFFFSSTRTRASFEAGMAQLGGHAQFIESQDHPDRPRRHGQGDRRDPRPLQRRDRHPAVRLGDGQHLHPRRRRGQPRARAEHAVRHLPPAPGAGRPHDDHRAVRRPARQDRDGELGLRAELPQADQRAAEPGAAAAPFRDERPARAPAGVPAHARHHRAGQAERPRRARRLRDHGRLRRGVQGHRRRLRQELGGAADHHRPGRGRTPDREVRVLDHRRAADGAGRTRTRSSCTRCRPTATSRWPTA